MSRTPTKFVAQVTIQHFVVEVSPAPHCWLDFGGTWVPEAGIDDRRDERAADIMARFCAIPRIHDRDIEYNGHFGPFFYYACDVEDSERVGKAVIALLRRFERRMRSTKAYKEAQRRGVGHKDVLQSLSTPAADGQPQAPEVR